MAGTFTVEWLPGGILLQRRGGLFTVDEAKSYAAAAKAAIKNAPPRWCALVDAREAVAQTDEVQAVIQDLIKYVVANNVTRVAIITKSALTGIQQKRITTAPGMHDPKTIGFHHDYDEALAELRAALNG